VNSRECKRRRRRERGRGRVVAGGGNDKRQRLVVS